MLRVSTIFWRLPLLGKSSLAISVEGLRRRFQGSGLDPGHAIQDIPPSLAQQLVVLSKPLLIVAKGGLLPCRVAHGIVTKRGLWLLPSCGHRGGATACSVEERALNPTLIRSGDTEISRARDWAAATESGTCRESSSNPLHHSLSGR
ncbi:hypothetical protein GGR56DRAFT_578612 [Xylariaceae sp. FL0804]|nr:hypothetical protein GGR56DRAFT_578612 [Xylariaceae sp. FL0804]